MAEVLPSDELVEEPSDFGAMQPGTRLGRYELLVPIARGGMARVWAARMTGQRGFQKLVALKTILPHLAEEPEFEVVAYDNFSTGHRGFLSAALGHARFSLVEGDTLDLEAMTRAMKGCNLVVHFAANADVRFGTDHPRKDLEQNTIATFNVLEAMRANGVKRQRRETWSGKRRPGHVKRIS